jgi:preprotein translocase subunit SecA
VRIPPSRFQETVSREGLEELVGDAVRERYAERERELGADLLRALERHEMLIVIDTQWKDHLLSIDHLKEGIGLRGYGQRDPLTEYKREAFDLFQEMAERVKGLVVERLFKVQIVRDAPMELPAVTAWADTTESRGESAEGRRAAASKTSHVPSPRAADGSKIGRNDPCPCGSGKKYKRCCYLKQAG